MTELTTAHKNKVIFLSWFVHRKVSLVLSIIFIIFIFIAFFISPFVASSASKINFSMRSLEPFSLKNGFFYFFGSDSLGRSLMLRIIYASQYTLFITFASVFIAFVIGGTLGIIAGFKGGVVASLIMRFTDAIMSFPLLLLSILLLYILQAQNNIIIIVLAASRIPLLLRISRAETLRIRESLFVTAAKTMNISATKILFRHVLPNVLPVLLTFSGLEISAVMLAESSLSFIGLGVQAPDSSWGMLIAQGSQYISTSWWLATFPGLMIVATALSFNVLTLWVKNKINPMKS